MPTPADGGGLQDGPGSSVKAAVTSLHYAFPSVVFAYYILSSTIAVCTLQTQSPAGNHVRRRVISLFLLFSVLTYLAQLVILLVQGITRHEFPAEQDTIISLLSCILVFGVELAGLSETAKPVWYPYIGSLGLALLFEPAIAALSLAARPHEPLAYAELVDIATVAARYLSFVLALIVYFEGLYKSRQESGSDAERQTLLPKEDGNGALDASAAGEDEGQQNGYGATSDTATETSTNASQSPTAENPESPWERREREASKQMEKRLKEKGNWVTYAKSFVIFIPYVWPVKNRQLQLRVILVGFCLLSMNAVNFLIPRQLGIVMDSLNGLDDQNPWTEVLLFAGLRLLASESGISLLRQWLWIPVEYYSYDAMSTAAYSHVLNLSSDFHDTKSSSDIMMAIQSGQSISNMLESLCFYAIPMLVDMSIAFIYLSVTFGPYEGFITIATAVIFMYIATRMISSLRDARRREVSAWFEEHYVRQAGIQGWATVACFNQIGHEETRYATAVKDRVAKSQKLYFGYALAYAFQYLVLLAGLLAGAFLAVYQVTHGQATPGQFIMLLTYWGQLVGPLSFFANLGKRVSRDLIQAEQLLEIMQMKPTIVNKELAPPLEFSGGAVRFDHVCFSYDKKKDIIKDISFTAAPGETIAFVGATGAGKSTILKLLDRFYDVTEGSIQIDGQDIRDVDLRSLRTQIGVVPQSPILFDDTILNNVRYAKLDATDEEIYEACKAACIHEQVLGFSDGYQTRVGERGVKVSGGELQRIAIARAILKRPAIVLLDEATSAVDTETEQRIQEALRKLCMGRTTFIVAHRLSTIMNADRIIVVNGGEITEQGGHEELIRAGGKYAELWSKQIFVKPKDKPSADDDKSKAKGTKPPNILNDLTPEVTSSELAKVKSAPALRALCDSQVKDAGNGDQTPERDSQTGHKKEGSRLNPDAPPFTPRSMRTGVSIPVAASSPTKMPCSLSVDGSLGGSRAVSPAAYGVAPPPTLRPYQYYTPVVMVPAAPYSFFHQPLSSASGNVARRVQSIEEEDDWKPQPAAASRQAPASSPDDAAKENAQPTLADCDEGLKHPYYSRRFQSKSEPSGPGSSPSP